MMRPGQEAENRAVVFLQERGLRLVTRNYRCRMGEIDLIMEDGRALVFVEVRERRDTRFGGAAASITGHKQHRLILAAQHYLQRQPVQPPCRFDAVLVEGSRMEWIKDAFSA